VRIVITPFHGQQKALSGFLGELLTGRLRGYRSTFGDLQGALGFRTHTLSANRSGTSLCSRLVGIAILPSTTNKKSSTVFHRGPGEWLALVAIPIPSTILWVVGVAN